MTSMPPKARGELAEVVFLCVAMARGLVVAKPWGDNLPFDFLVGPGGKSKRYYRVQVKVSAAKDFHAYAIKSFHRGAHTAYTPAEIDFIAGYIEPEKVWYIIPARAIRGKKMLAVFPGRQNSRGRLERYREAWDLLQR